MKIDIAGVLVDKVTKQQVLDLIDGYVQSGQPHLVVTVYSEFIVFAHKDETYLQVLNKADLAIADGSGILWAAKYLSLRASSLIQRLFQFFWTGASLVFNPEICRTVLPEKISGSKLIWDLASLASEKNYSLALVGGQDSVAAKAAVELHRRFPQLKIKLSLSGREFDGSMVEEIAASNSDILCLAYQPPLQEKWLAQNLQDLNVKVAIGLGGTFDYIAKKRLSSPGFLSNLGLEWLWRLVTQPWRIKRMWNAIPVFAAIIYKASANKLYGQN